MRRRRRIVLVVLVVCVVGAVVLAIPSARLAVQMEDTLQATTTAIYVLEDFIRVYRRWPQDADEFYAFWTTQEETVGGRGWMMQRTEIEKRVSIQFGVDPCVIAAQPLEDFRAIQPIGPCFESWRHYGRIETLQRAIRESIECE